jgi:hypothetical protein
MRELREIYFTPRVPAQLKRVLLEAGATLMDLHATWRVTGFLADGGFADVFRVLPVLVDGERQSHLPDVQDAALKARQPTQAGSRVGARACRWV